VDRKNVVTTGKRGPSLRNATADSGAAVVIAIVCHD